MTSKPESVRSESDSELLQRVAKGDHHAFETLYLRHRESLLNFIARRYQSQDAHLAEDMVSEVFVRFWQNRRKLISVKNLRAYLRGMARNITSQQLRTKRALEEMLSPDKPSGLPYPGMRIEQDETRQQIHQAIAKLAKSRRIAFELAEEGLTARQIALVVGCSEKAAERRIEKAKEELKLNLAKGMEMD